MDMKRWDVPKCDQCDNSDVMFPYQEAIADRFLNVDSLVTERMWYAGLPLHATSEDAFALHHIDPPDNAVARYVFGLDPGGDEWAMSCMGYFIPDGYWPPVSTIEEWASRRAHRVEKTWHMPARYQRCLLALIVLGIFWVFYGADKVLG